MQLFQYKPIGLIESMILEASMTRTAIILYNNHATQIIYLSRAKGVSTVNGFPLPPGASLAFKIPEDDVTGELWAIADGADTDLRYIESFGLVPRRS
ncbi:unnamed protein product [marine sediment metagenome]|uniref:Uncharacterized protein n=1 Tax=marine sediment metagenome TaxID=412755 RepID=X1DJ65_9ZZZZ